MLPFKLSETSLRRQVNDKSWSRGQSYYKSGSVVNVVCRGNNIQAQVEGTDYEPYRVSLEVDPGGFKSATCSCPYDWGGWCKHIAAVGMLSCRDPQKVRIAPPVKDLLNLLDVEDLRELTLELLAEEPGLVERVEAFAKRLADLEALLDEDFEGEAISVEVQVVGTTIRSSRKPNYNGQQKESAQSQSRKRQTRIDPAPYRGQAHQVIRNTVRACEDGWDDYDIELEGFPELFAKPEDFIKAGDGANALIILDAITGTLAGEWSEVLDYGYDGDIAAQALDPLWAEALLQTELTDDEAMDWQVQLEEYAAQFAWEEFPLASEVLRQGWEDLALQEVLEGTANELWEGEAPAHADELAQIRLRILARQGRWEEYLNFAKAEEQFRDWLVTLIQWNEGEQALAEVDCLETVTDAQAVAEAFRAQGNLSAAVEVAQQGIELPSPQAAWRSYAGVSVSASSESFKPDSNHYELAAWAAQLSEQVEDEVTMLELWARAIAIQPKVSDFNHLEMLAGEQWPKMRDRLLDQLEASETWSYNAEDIEIFLAEGRIQAAIKKLDGYHSRDMTIKVMKAAISHDPDWVIRKGRAGADDIMNRGKASHYDLAVKYLTQVKAAYLHQSKQAAWKKYRSQIQASHGRKRKLINLMASASLD